MPGVVTQLLVGANHTVKKDDVLLTLEAMKMEYTIRAPKDGVILDAYFQVGDQVKVVMSLWTSKLLRGSCMSDYVKIVEVGPRDGLQNEKQALSIEQRLSFINDLIDAGLKFIEVGSCVSAKWVPQMSQSDKLFKLLPQRDDLNLSLLTPNLKGFDAALAVGCKEVAVFTAASESFTRKNINCSIDESLERFSKIFQAAQANHVRVRGYVSCMVDCPYEGAIDPKQVVNVVKRLYEMGCYEISLGETIGTATPDRVQKVWQACLAELDSNILVDIFIILMAWQLPISINLYSKGFESLILRLLDWVVVHMPKVHQGMLQLRICIIYCLKLDTKQGSI